jgi:site-specific DNA recombinase
LLSSEIDPSDYKIIKASCEKKIAVLESKLFDRDSSDYKIDHLLENAINVIGKLDCLYVDGDIKKKRQIIGSIYPENLIFDGIDYRTARLNEAIELIYSIDKCFSGKKMDKPMKKSICPNR